MHVDLDGWDHALPNQRLLPIKSLNLGAFRRRKFLSHRYAIFLVLAIAMASLTGLLWSMFRNTLPDGGVAFGDEEQDTSSLEAIVSQCEIFMRKNLLTGTAYGYNYSFNQPSSFKYSPSQWLWGKILSGLFRQASCVVSSPRHTDQRRLGRSPDIVGSPGIPRPRNRGPTLHT